MRSVYIRVLVWCLATLLLSFAAFIGITVYISNRAMENRGPFHRLSSYLLDECIEAWTTGGRAQLRAVTDRQQRRLAIESHFVESTGRDVLTGQDMSSLLGRLGGIPGEPLVTSSSDGMYRLILVFQPPDLHLLTYLPYYLLILIALAGLCWRLSVSIGSPLNQLGHVVKQFGSGDLDARIDRLGQDEIGDLGRAFNEMAGRLQNLLRAERQLLQDVSHELRSPLVRLSFAAELIRTAPDRDEAVDRINSEIGRLSTLVHGLLEVTRAEGELTDRNFQTFDLGQLMTEMAELCDIEATAKNCSVETNSVRGKVYVRGDSELLRRAIENILSNAIRHAPSGSTIEVAVRQYGQTATASVRDQGPGVPANMLEKIFSPFVRVDESRQTSTGGVGLGLSIAKRAVLLHHGRILAENTEPGLKVTVSLPLATSVRSS